MSVLMLPEPASGVSAERQRRMIVSGGGYYAATPSTGASAWRPRIISEAFSAIIIVDE